MKSMSTIRIPNPSAELVALLDKVHQQKAIRMKQMREKLKKVSQ